MQHPHTEVPSHTSMQFPNQPQMQQSMQSIQQPIQSIQQPMQSIQQPMQSIQQPMQSIQQPMQSIQQPMQSIQQAMMLWPVQFVYDSQMQMAQAKTDEQVQQVQQNSTYPSNTYIINVQNPPPWIQNRNMNQIVYMPQLTPNNMQPYIQQHMVQNPMYIQQYQQPSEQVRVQIPHLMQQNMMHSPQNTQPQTMPNVMRMPMEIKQERMPLLTQILQEQSGQGLRKIQNEMTQVQMIRPTYQNIRPQMITVSPMPTNHSCAHHTTQTNRESNQVVNEIPPHIRSQIPEGLSVKTIYKPVPMTMVRPNEYQNIAPASIPNATPLPPVPKLVKNSTTNTDNRITSYNKKRPTIVRSENVSFKKPCTKLEEDTAKLLCKMKNDAIANKMKMEMQANRDENTVIERTEEKPIRNTVFVQARGRINELVAINTNINNNDIIEDPPQNTPESTTVEAVEKEVGPLIEDPPKDIPAPMDTTIGGTKEDSDSAIIKEEMPKEVKTVVKENSSPKERVRQFVLTHVLDGHIIQESNVPFTIKKPSKSPKKLTSHNNTGETDVSFDSLREKTEVKETTEAAPVREEPPKEPNEDNPFENIRRTTVKAWTVSELFAHLHHHQWGETAQKLREEEIDGESLVLVSREQLLSVGIEERHADVICSFLDTGS